MPTYICITMKVLLLHTTVSQPNKQKSLFKTKYVSFRPSDRATEQPTNVGVSAGVSMKVIPERKWPAGLSGGRIGTLPSVSSSSLHQAAAHPFFCVGYHTHIADAFKRLDRLQHHLFFFCFFECGGASISSINLHRLAEIPPTQTNPVEEVSRSKSEERPQARIKRKTRMQQLQTKSRVSSSVPSILPSSISHPRLRAWGAVRSRRPETLRN